MKRKAPVPALPQLNENAKMVLERRYLRRDADGTLRETPQELFGRVARAVAEPEGRRRKHWEERYLRAMTSLRFLPNSPTLMNAGSGGQLSACYVLPVEDDLGGIFDSLKNAAKIHQSGGGTGFSFSRLRPKGAAVGSALGVASGPVSFMKIYDVATETIKQGGARRGANMAVLRVDHPDILEFIEAKRDQKALSNFNLSVGATGEFMAALLRGASYEKALFDRIVQEAWAGGDPGMVFLDRLNLFNPTPGLGEMESTNPCGEQPLLPFESCNLGSLNLGEFCRDSAVAWPLLREEIHTAIRFLDDVIEINGFPLSQCAEVTRGNRKVGLGVMGFADLLLMLGIPYDRPDAFALGERIMSFIDREAKRASFALAKERGRFPRWRGSLWEHLGYPAMRNACVSTVAPTGTISIIAGASSGIEPIFSGLYYRNILSGERLLDVHPAVQKLIGGEAGRVATLSEEEMERRLGAAWRPAHKISVESHVRMQAAFQRHSDSAVSKTINLPADSTPEDVAKAYLLAYKLGCKGITVYRDKSRSAQVLDHAVCKTC